ncbi:hypothetical protein N802_17265 [Knoellia sinensis KCTC 19936]|uniref:N-acetyltransferase domain-containing protein n=1 Tax=Knoellia sinensis KCTC 19936 TaxID=1385520 RepID=A0A0A0JAQ0_9MICO|nr:GNAT family N-acetyltransferase [Knoellia sinensis]KGN32696.1 hypothetical protein N802_17265 [Knoellia sinensis KCTC 19936]
MSNIAVDLHEARENDPSTQRAVTAFTSAMRILWSAFPDGAWRDSADLVRYDTEQPTPRFNGVVVLGPEADEESASQWLDALAGRGLPYCILSRPSAPEWVAGLASRHHLDRVEHEPFMIHSSPAEVVVPQGTVISRVDPEDAGEVALAQQLFADGFEGPVEVLGSLMTAEVLRLPEMEAYVGRADGQPCTTGFGTLTDGHVGVFNIATPPAYRTRGHGHAITAAVMAAGAAAGAHTAYLQASEMGYPIYERMGFRAVELWPSYYPAE